jgi:hypothetical protein
MHLFCRLLFTDESVAPILTDLPRTPHIEVQSITRASGRAEWQSLRRSRGASSVGFVAIAEAQRWQHFGILYGSIWVNDNLGK